MKERNERRKRTEGKGIEMKRKMIKGDIYGKRNELHRALGEEKGMKKGVN